MKQRMKLKELSADKMVLIAKLLAQLEADNKERDSEKKEKELGGHRTRSNRKETEMRREPRKTVR